MVGSLIVIAFFVAVAVAFAYWHNRNWIRYAAGPNPKPVGEPACGKCGYPARGISTLSCPECGADLRIVGIRLPGQRGTLASIISIAVIYSIVFLVISGTLYGIINEQLPRYMQVDSHVDLGPASGAYEAYVSIEGQQPIASGQGYSSSFGFYRKSSHGAPTLSLRLEGTQPNLHLRLIEVRVDPANAPTGNWAMPSMIVDPNTGEARWNDINANIKQSKSRLTDQDMIAFFKDAGMDTAQQQISDEARELYSFIDALLTQKNQFALQGFRHDGSGAGMSGGGGPEWFDPVYNLSAIGLWIVGLMWIIRTMRRGQRLASPAT